MNFFSILSNVNKLVEMYEDDVIAEFLRKMANLLDPKSPVKATTIAPMIISDLSAIKKKIDEKKKLKKDLNVKKTDISEGSTNSADDDLSKMFEVLK